MMKKIIFFAYNTFCFLM